MEIMAVFICKLLIKLIKKLLLVLILRHFRRLKRGLMNYGSAVPITPSH